MIKPTIDPSVKMGKNALIRSGVVLYPKVEIGDNFHAGHNAIIREGNKIGNNVSIGSLSELGPRNTIGNNTRIHSGCFLEDVTLGDSVFVGPHVVFTNDPHPKFSEHKKCFKGAHVGDGAIIGGHATILPHITIGKKAFIGAGSVVTKDVGDYEVVVGNPAKKIKNLKDIVCKKLRRPHKPYV